MGTSIVGVETDGLLVGGQRLLVALKVMESVPPIEVDASVVGVEANGLLVGGQRPLVTPGVIVRVALLLPLLLCLLRCPRST